VKALAAPLLAVQSDTDHPVTSDDNTARTPGDSPVPIPANIVKSPVPARLKKTKGKKGKHSSYQSRYHTSNRVFWLTIAVTRRVIARQRGKRDESGVKAEPTKQTVETTRNSISVQPQKLPRPSRLQRPTSTASFPQSRIMTLTLMRRTRMRTSRRPRPIEDGEYSVILLAERSSQRRT